MKTSSYITSALLIGYLGCIATASANSSSGISKNKVEWNPTNGDILKLERRLSVIKNNIIQKNKIRFYSGHIKNGKKFISGSLWTGVGNGLIPPTYHDYEGALLGFHIVEKIPWVQMETKDNSCPVYVVSYNKTEDVLEENFCYPLK